MTERVVEATEPSQTPASRPGTPLTREQLYEWVWREPMLRIAEKLGVSSSYMARVCTELYVPRPQRGHWAQLEVGKAPSKPPLPPALPGGLVEWEPGSELGTTRRSIERTTRSVMPAPAIDEPPAPQRELRAQGAPRQSRTQLAQRHELLTGVRPHFLKTRDSDNGILRPYKRLLVDVMSSEVKLDDALDAAQALFAALTAKGFHVALPAPGSQLYRAQLDLLDKPSKRNYHRNVWTPQRPTVVFIGELAIGLTVFEMTEEVEVVYVNGEYVSIRTLSALQLRRYTGPHHWTSTEERASGRLCVQAYCPSGLVEWAKRWQEAKPGEFVSLIPAVVKELEQLAPELSRRLNEARLKAEEELRKWEEDMRRHREAAERARQEKARHDARQDLLSAIQAWDEERRIHEYFAAVERALQRQPAEEKAGLSSRLALARELVGDLNPLDQLRGWRAPGER